jgi:hypothetical protein
MKNLDSSNSLLIFHQNVRGLRRKSDELNSFDMANINSNILCFSERHMEEQDLLHLTLPGDILGSSFRCHKTYRREVCAFLFEKIYISTKLISVNNCKEKDLEICATQLEIKTPKLVIFSLYRAPTRGFNQFIKDPFDTLKYLYKPKAEFLVCADMNTDYLIESY